MTSDMAMDVIRYLGGRPSFFTKERAKQVIKNLTGMDATSFYTELDASKLYEGMFDRNNYLIKNKLGNVPIETEAKFLYALCRAVEPDRVVETGPGTGISSSFILQALDANEKGTMWSIESGVLAINPLNLEFGQFVPKGLRGRWHLLMGESKKVLPSLLNDLKSIDVFFHDSDHSYENMMWEFETAWPHIRNGGVLCADDINFNSAFRDFCSNRKLTPEPYSRFSRFGIAKKTEG